MSVAVYVPGVYVTGVYVEDVVILVDIDVGPPGAARHRTALGSTRATDLVYWPAESPWAPYDAQPVFAIWGHIGLYAFMKVMPPQNIQDIVYHADNTLISVSPINFQAVPIGANLLGSISAGQRPTGTAVIANYGGWWNPRLNDEAWLCMGAGLFVLIRQLWYQPILTGTIGRIRLVEDTTVIDYGMFKRDVPSIPGRIFAI